jgi:hypothetical protein
MIIGKLDPFFETGTEGVIWSVYEDGKQGYDGLQCLDYGDLLTIYDKEDPTKVLWEGRIDLEWERNFRSYPMNPEHGQQEVLGYWVHGLQRDVEPETWGRWFFNAHPAKLEKLNLGRFSPLPNKSSSITAYSWLGTGGLFDEGKPGDLIIKFNGQNYYRYKDVPPEVFWQFYEAESHGKYFAQNIKDKYITEKVSIPTT